MCKLLFILNYGYIDKSLRNIEKRSHSNSQGKDNEKYASYINWLSFVYCQDKSNLPKT